MRPVFTVLLCLCMAVTLTVTAVAAPLSAVYPTDSVSHTLLPARRADGTPPPATSAACYAVLEPSSGELIAAHNADERRPMASTTKIMTALLVLERCDLDDVVTVDPRAVGVEGSSIYLFAGERITVRDLLYGLMLASANDAAVALAIHTAGSEEAFVAQMNRKAAELGLQNTQFCNPHGLYHEAHYTTARELAMLTARALKVPTFAEIVATKRHTAPQEGTQAVRLFRNHNRLLKSLEGAIGVKTGYTKASGRCLVSAAKREGLTLIAVTLNAPNDWQDHTALLEWGFSHYTAFSHTPEAVTIPVVGGREGTVQLTPVGTCSVTLPAEHPEVTCTVEAPRFLHAGIKAGTQVGRIVYRMGSTVLCELPLVSATDTAPLPSPSLWDKLKNLFAS